MDNQIFIQKIKNRDHKAFKELVGLYQKMVLNICIGYVHNTSDAQDLAQEVFIEIYNKIDSFRSDSKLSTWIYRIAVNKSLNYIRDNKIKKGYLSLSPNNNSSKDIQLPISACEESDYQFENNERKKRLYTAIDSLPENQRSTFILNKYDGKSYKEISEIMDITLSSVESLLFRAKQNLQKKLFECYKNLKS